MSEINFKIDQTVEWLRGKVKEANCNGLVVGVSGACDRSVGAHLFRQQPDDPDVPSRQAG